MGVAAFARAGIEYPQTRRHLARELRDRFFDDALEMQHVAAQEIRKMFGNRGVAHEARFRASIITVDPAAAQASKSVNGRAATTRERYSRSFITRFTPDSRVPRMRRAMGSSEGARLVGKYINLTDPKITRPWIGLIVSNQRIDGRWTGGRLDFRR